MNLLQAGFTTLSDDEAYYWMYSKFLDWGYFHQPPMIGAFIKAGYAMFQNELGVRLVSVLLNTVSLHLIFTMTDRKDPKLFWAIIGGTLLVHVAGFFAVPDSPLIFFGTLFLWLLKKYIEKDRWTLAFLLGVTAALLLYGKYHGIFILGFALLANLDLLRRGSFWIIPIVGVAAFFPHAWWQISNDFPGFAYHMTERFGDWFNLENTINFVLGQLILTGPLIGFLTLWGGFRYRAKDKFIRTLKFLFVGELLFFFFWSFKGQIEGNWTAGGFIGLFVLSYFYFKDRPKGRQWVFRLSIPTVLIILLFRVNLMVPMVDLVSIYPKLGEFYGWEEFVEKVEEKRGDRVVMAMSYQMASKLSYYMGEEVTSLNQYARGNEYDLWHLERKHAGADVAVIIGDQHLGGEKIVSPRGDTLRILLYDNFKIYKEVYVIPEEEKPTLPKGQTVQIPVTVNNPYDYTIETLEVARKSYLCYHWWKDGQIYKWDGIRTYGGSIPSGESKLELNVLVPDEPGTYFIEPCLVTHGYGWWSPKKTYEVIVE